MRICVMGTGHVGLVTCVTLAKMGHEVIGVDSDEEKVQTLRSGRSPFFEPGVEELLQEGLDSGALSFSHLASEGVPGSEVVFICVGTPARSNGQANLVAVEQAADSVASHATRRLVLVEKSTVPAGTSARVRDLFLRHRGALSMDLEIVSNPEFLREGHAVQDSFEPERILVGSESEWALGIMRQVYAPLLAKGVPMIETNVATAELAKHACNAFLAMKISYANALARICEALDADVTSVADVMGTDSRIGRQFLNAGLGYGGYCFPKDVAAFEQLAADAGYDFALLRAVADINEDTVNAAVAKVEGALWNLEDKRVSILGLAFKPGTDDVRFSPALELAKRLIDKGASVVGYDPEALHHAKGEVPALELANDPYAAVEDSHCVVVATEWSDFKELDLGRMAGLMTFPIMLDARNAIDPQAASSAGLIYHSMGRAVVAPRA